MIDLEKGEIAFANADGEDLKICKAFLLVVEIKNLDELKKQHVAIKSSCRENMLVFPLDKVYLKTHKGWHYFCLPEIEHWSEVRRIKLFDLVESKIKGVALGPCFSV